MKIYAIVNRYNRRVETIAIFLSKDNAETLCTKLQNSSSYDISKGEGYFVDEWATEDE
jgi:hypothetical protein